jgi:hypothetical protein
MVSTRSCNVNHLNRRHFMITVALRLRRHITVIFFLGLLLEVSAVGGEIGLKSEYREIGRRHSDSESIGSKIIHQNADISFNYVYLDALSLQFSESQEQWTFAHPDGTRYFSFDFRRHLPKLKYQRDSWKIELTIPVVDVAANNGLYSRIAQDDREQFVLPALVGEYRLSDWIFQLGGWQETDIQPFNYYRYTLFVLHTTSVGVGYQLSENQSIMADFRVIDRIYPEDYGLKKDEIQATYRLLNPLEIMDTIQWQEMSLQYIQTRYSELNTNKLDLSNNFRFLLGGLNHFLTHRFRFTDAITTYREGIYQYALIEEDKMKNDLWQKIEYSGFWKIFSSNFFLSWKYWIEDSLVENVILDQGVQLKVVYTF